MGGRVLVMFSPCSVLLDEGHRAVCVDSVVCLVGVLLFFLGCRVGFVGFPILSLVPSIAPLWLGCRGPGRRILLRVVVRLLSSCRSLIRFRAICCHIWDRIGRGCCRWGIFLGTTMVRVCNRSRNGAYSLVLSLECRLALALVGGSRCVGCQFGCGGESVRCLGWGVLVWCRDSGGVCVAWFLSSRVVVCCHIGIRY